MAVPVLDNCYLFRERLSPVSRIVFVRKVPLLICNDLSRLAIHTMTNRPWLLAECIEHYTQSGIPVLSV